MIENHPLAEAARYNDAQAEEMGVFETILNSNLDPIVVMNVAQQRAMRFVIGLNYGQDGVDLIADVSRDRKVAKIELTENDMNMINEISIAFIDGIMIGWRAHTISSRNTTN